eukprot:gb/GFBE01015334.1/.p1 GENE.gb/GFBE01015334.1/~~gb/GFBE01015334.1/.p1  ORF type:complete len:323 (+),score=89.37 gb/GFBE01015334.1/:1-969(+)
MVSLLPLQLASLLLAAAPLAEAADSMLEGRAEGNALFQSGRVGPVFKAMPSTLGAELGAGIAEEELLAEAETDEGDYSVPLVGSSAMAAEKAPLEGVALLWEDLRWVSNLVASLFAWLVAGLKVIYSDILAWATAFVSFSLTRSLLASGFANKGATADKLEASEECDQESEVSDCPEELDDIVEEDEKNEETEKKQELLEHLRRQRAQEEQEEKDQRKRMIKQAQKEDRDLFGCTALHLASHYGYADDVEKLLDAGFDVNARERSHETPLHMAARAGCIDTAKVLLSRGADPKTRNSFGKTPFSVAMHSNEALAQLLRAASR